MQSFLQTCMSTWTPIKFIQISHIFLVANPNARHLSFQPLGIESAQGSQAAIVDDEAP